MSATRRPTLTPARLVLLRDRDGRRLAVARHAVSALCEADDGATTLLLPGGRVVVIEQPIEDVMALLA